MIGNYPELDPEHRDDYGTVAPGQRLLRLSNNYGGNIFGEIIAFPAPYTYLGNWRTDGSLDELGPYIQPFPTNVLTANSVVSAD